ncbi:MAG TPA: LysM peptidoglycan-binding domain-containing protein [Bacilli bacterium]
MHIYTTYRVGSYPNKLKKQIFRSRRNHFLRISLLFIVMILFLTVGTILNVYANNTNGLESNQTIYAERGDTLWTIAESHKPDNSNIKSYIYKIKKLNGMNTSIIREGQKLMLP